MCGAAAATDAARCLYCSARLASIACPSCFGMMFLGSRHCQHCGARAADAQVKTTVARLCPRCRTGMESFTVGTTDVRECARCGGLWIDAEAFERICSEREEQSAALAAPVQKPANANSVAASGVVRYVPCPECGQLMNRVNFARCSGVVVDVCKNHGTWFDHAELQRVVEFIRAGGMSASRAREIEQLAEERRRLQQEQLAAGARSDSLFGFRDNDERQSRGGFGAGELIKLLLD
jgi:Zn-finger nucleic acid-binding protein